MKMAKTTVQAGVIALLVKEVNLLRGLVKVQEDLLYFRQTGPHHKALSAQDKVVEIRKRLETMYSR